MKMIFALSACAALLATGMTVAGTCRVQNTWDQAQYFIGITIIILKKLMVNHPRSPSHQMATIIM